MTPNEWQALGLYAKHSLVHEAFMRAKFSEFVVTQKHEIIGTIADGPFNYILGQFRTQEQAEVVALTLRMLNPA